METDEVNRAVMRPATRASAGICHCSCSLRACSSVSGRLRRRISDAREREPIPIVQELRRRAEERGRPREELEYIDRLLKQF